MEVNTVAAGANQMGTEHVAPRKTAIWHSSLPWYEGEQDTRLLNMRGLPGWAPVMSICELRGGAREEETHCQRNYAIAK